MLQSTPTLSRNVHSQVSDWIGLSILRGDIRPGESLPSELQICEMMDVSRTVVREAIRTLNGKGLVESRAKSGTRVCPREQWSQLDPDVMRWQMETKEFEDYLAKLQQLRRAIEPQAAALAAVNASEEDMGRLRAGYEGMIAARDPESFAAADASFHQSIYLATRNEFFWPIAQMFKVALRRAPSAARHGDEAADGLDAHRGVLNAIASRNAEEARVAAGALLSRSAFSPAGQPAGAFA
jgi:DNA-binding FadR family transcriptional regulator